MRSHTSLWPGSGSFINRRVVRWTFVSVAIAIAFVIGTSDVLQGHEHKQTHRKLTAAGFRLLNSDFLRRDRFLTEIQIVNLLAEGAIEEDKCIVSKYGRSYQNQGHYHSHFYDAGTGKKLDSPTPDGEDDNGEDCAPFEESDRQTAPDRARALWNNAVTDYRADTLETRRSAFYIIGRVLHLLEDMTSPPHVHNDPHGWAIIFVGCEGDIDDFEVWGHCDGFSDRISDYVRDSSSPQACSNGTTAPPPFTCRMWSNLNRLYNAEPQGTEDSANPVPRGPTENPAAAFVRHVARVTYDFTRFRVFLIDPTNKTDEQPESELTRMLRGSKLANCGAGVTDVGLCDTGALVIGGAAWDISGDFQEIGRTSLFWGACGRTEGDVDSSQQWWLDATDCVSVGENRMRGFAYLENSGGVDPEGFVPLRYGCLNTVADKAFCGDAATEFTARSKPLYQQLYGTVGNPDNKTLLRIYGDVLYTNAVVYAAGMIQTFIDVAAGPVADAGGPYTGEACKPITFDGSKSTDPNGSIVLYQWDFDGGGIDFTSLDPTAKASFPSPATGLVKLIVTDNEGLTDDDTADVTITPDVTPPQITSAIPTPSRLWPTNHQMVPVQVAVSVEDECGKANTSCRIVNVTSSEPGSGRGRAARGADWVLTGPLKLNLRAERAGASVGRIYTITIECADKAGNKTSKNVVVTVPHDQRR